MSNRNLQKESIPIHIMYTFLHQLPWWLSGKESACNAGDPSVIPYLGRSPGKGNGYLHQYSCLENPMDRDAWQTVHGLAKNWACLSD